MILMIQEENMLLGGNCSVDLGTTPTPTVSNAGTGGSIGAATYNVICVALFVVFFQHSFQVISNIKNVTREISAAMQLPMWIMYLSTAISFGLGAIRSVEAVIDNIRNFSAKSLSTIEATVQDAKAEVDLLKKEGGDK